VVSRIAALVLQVLSVRDYDRHYIEQERHSHNRHGK